MCVIGGMAMIQAGFVRGTEDIDLLIEASPENQAAVRKALEILPDKAVTELREGDLRTICCRARGRRNCCRPPAFRRWDSIRRGAAGSDSCRSNRRPNPVRVSPPAPANEANWEGEGCPGSPLLAGTSLSSPTRLRSFPSHRPTPLFQGEQPLLGWPNPPTDSRTLLRPYRPD